jgi:L-asparaginase
MASPVVLNITRLVQSSLDNNWIHGVVVTHGTDTLEETAFFLSSVIDSKKPVVIVGSMRPHTALSADGPLNLLEAITLAATPEAEGRGVMVVLNDRIASAHYVTKTHANSVDTFHAVEQGYLGYFDNTIPKFYFAPARPVGWRYFNVTGLIDLPHVDIHYGHQGLNPALVNTSVETGAEGIVLAGMGAGGWSQVGSKVLYNLVDTHGTMVVISHRTQDGTVSYVKDWVIGSGLLNAQKSRILLQLAINAGYSFNETKAMFEL